MAGGGWDGLRQFLILLYKGLLLRKRHYIVSFAEIAIPIIIACIPAMIISEGSVRPYTRSNKVQDRSIWKNYTTFPPFDPFLIFGTQRESLEFVYTPPHEITNKFMNDSLDLFLRKVYNNKLELIPRSMKTEKELEIYCISQQKKNPYLTVIGTIFNNFEDKLPASLDYTLRFSSGVYDYDFENERKYRMKGPNLYNGPVGKNINTACGGQTTE